MGVIRGKIQFPKPQSIELLVAVLVAQSFAQSQSSSEPSSKPSTEPESLFKLHLAQLVLLAILALIHTLENALQITLINFIFKGEKSPKKK